MNKDICHPVIKGRVTYSYPLNLYSYIHIMKYNKYKGVITYDARMNCIMRASNKKEVYHLSKPLFVT